MNMDDEKQPEKSNSASFMPSNNIDESELDQETVEKLKGDCIGDTVYSQTFVLKTLLQYSDLNWSEDFEQDLCSIWDMTVNEDVSKFLLNLSYSSLACSAVLNYQDNSRFVEIVIGIFANILSVCKDEKIKEEEVNIIISILESEDPYILIQVMRFMIGIAHNHNSVEFINEEIMIKIIFILNNSLNEELLLKTFYFVISTTGDFKLEKKLVTYDLFIACVKAYESLLKIYNSEENEREFDTSEKQQILRNYIESIYNISCYVEKYQNDSLQEAIRSKTKTILKEFSKIYTYFSQSDNLLPISDEIDSLFTNTSYLIQFLDAPFIDKLFIPMFKISYILINSEMQQEECFKSIAESLCYFIHKSDAKTVHKTLLEKCSLQTMIKSVITVIKNSGFEFSFNYKNVLEDIDKLK